MCSPERVIAWLLTTFGLSLEGKERRKKERRKEERGMVCLFIPIFGGVLCFILAS